jgi:predicted dehydrogenase
MEPVRIAVAGAGLIGMRHIEEIRNSRVARLAAIVDPSPHAADIARREGVARYPSLEALFAQDRPDGIVLATPNALHVEQGNRANNCIFVAHVSIEVRIAKISTDTDRR